MRVCPGGGESLSRRWREFSRPITEHSKAKPRQSHIIFDTAV